VNEAGAKLARLGTRPSLGLGPPGRVRAGGLIARRRYRRAGRQNAAWASRRCGLESGQI